MFKLIIFILGFILGMFVTCIVVTTWKAGTLKLDMRDREKDIVRVEFDNINLMYERKYVLFVIDRNSDS